MVIAHDTGTQVIFCRSLSSYESSFANKNYAAFQQNRRAVAFFLVILSKRTGDFLCFTLSICPTTDFFPFFGRDLLMNLVPPRSHRFCLGGLTSLIIVTVIALDVLHPCA